MVSPRADPALGYCLCGLNPGGNLVAIDDRPVRWACALHRRSESIPDMKKLFIVGCPRSGTTMVQQALNRHSQIVIPPETKFFFSFFKHSWKQQCRHLERLNADLGIQMRPPASRVRTVTEGRAFYDLIAERYTRRLSRPDAVYFGDKTPEHTGYLPRIRELFPDAKVLVVYRDGRDVAVSLSRMPWMSRDVNVGFIVWLYYQHIVRGVRDCFGSQLYLARYEDVVSNPAREFGKIVNFLGLPHEPAVAEGFGNKEGIPEREYAWKARALEKITPGRVGVFRRDLTPGQIGILERLGRTTLPDLGYPLVSEGTAPLPLGFRFKLFFNVSKFVLGLPWRAVARELLMRSRSCCAGEGTPLAPHAVIA
jgi:Sulfotransferase family